MHGRGVVNQEQSKGSKWDTRCLVDGIDLGSAECRVT